MSLPQGKSYTETRKERSSQKQYYFPQNTGSTLLLTEYPDCSLNLLLIIVPFSKHIFQIIRSEARYCFTNTRTFYNMLLKKTPGLKRVLNMNGVFSITKKIKHGMRMKNK